MLLKKDVIRIFIFLIIINNLIFVAYYYPRLAGKLVYERVEVNVTRVIDGDTFESGQDKFRLLGINTPEKGELGYEQAKDFLLKYEGKQVEAEIVEKDKYGRNLAYIYYQNELINKEILEIGLAHLYYYDKDNNYGKMKKAEEQARKTEIGIWKKSANFGCVELVSLKYKENERCKNEEQLIINNKCEKIKAVLKDDATHIYDVNINQGIFIQNFSCIWNDEGDSIYIWDKEGLVLWYRYS